MLIKKVRVYSEVKGVKLIYEWLYQQNYKLWGPIQKFLNFKNQIKNYVTMRPKTII